MAIRKGYLGFTIITLTVASLALAIYRQQLALLLWAVFFLSLLALVLLLHLINFIYLKKLSCRLTVLLPSKVECGTPFHCEVAFNKKVRVLPFFNYYLCVNGLGKRAFFRQLFLLSTAQSQQYTLGIDKRAIYEVDYFIEAVDLFGFFSHKIKATNSNPLLSVMPVSPLASSHHITLPNFMVGSSISKQKRSDDRLDSRKYYPGDDPRLVNWKQASRFNELFIRLEEVGGSTANSVIILLMIAPYSGGSEERLDRLINYLVRLSANLTAEGSSCQLLIGNDVIDQFNGATELHRLLLAPYFTGQAGGMRLPKQLGHASLILMGDFLDSSYLDAVRTYADFKPFVVTANSEKTALADFEFLASSLGLEVALA